MKRYSQFVCPICSILVGPYSRGITFHAQSHGLTIQEFWLLVHNQSRPTCACSQTCNEFTSWKNWKEGFLRYSKGHYDNKHRSKLVKKRTFHWARGKNKENCEAIFRSAEKKSQTMKGKKNNHWCDSTHRQQVIEKISQKRKPPTRDSHWKWSDEIDLLARINESCQEKFEIKFIDNTKLTLERISSRRNNKEVILAARCLRCQFTKNVSVYSVIRSPLKCQACDRQYVSAFENDVGEFISKFEHRRKRYGPWGELDHYVESKNFAIECNGLYWHSDAINPDSGYHERKRILCEQQNISLFHIFEDEWRDKKNIVCSMIEHKLGRSKRMGARTLKIRSVDKTIRQSFFDANHIDGDVPACSSYALIDDQKQICAMASFRKPFFGQKNVADVELARYATLIGTNVTGGLSKILKNVPEGQREIMSYQDTRFGGSGLHYEAAGFEKIKVCAPRFWWTDTVHRFGRLTIKKSHDISENDHALIKRCFKIWGTSNVLWKRKNTQK